MSLKQCGAIQDIGHDLSWSGEEFALQVCRRAALLSRMNIGRVLKSQSSMEVVAGARYSPPAIRLTPGRAKCAPSGMKLDHRSRLSENHQETHILSVSPGVISKPSLP
jgi:hypothetical protein